MLLANPLRIASYSLPAAKRSIAPGAVLTRWWEGRQQQMEELAGSLLLGKTALPVDIAHMICAVLEQEALTGQIITVDAGQSM